MEDKKYYNEFSLEALTQFALHISKKQSKEDHRRMCIMTRKEGVLDYLEHFYKEAEFSEEEVKELLIRDGRDLKDCLYSISDEGIKPYGL